VTTNPASQLTVRDSERMAGNSEVVAEVALGPGNAETGQVEFASFACFGVPCFEKD
jgi:hypothetical protein